MEHVHKLRAGVAKHLETPHEFICLTDTPTSDVSCIPLKDNWPGWWAKISLFDSSLFDAGRSILYFDLDTVIVGSLDGLVKAAEHAPWIVLADFYRQPPRYRTISYGSGVMAFRAGAQRQIYDLFARNPNVRTTCTRGDQEWIEKTAPGATFWQEMAPNQIVSYKVHCTEGLPQNARVVAFHGKPKPWEVDASWIKEAA
jgi:hypothetical protein